MTQSTRHLIDRELEPLVEMFPSFDLSLEALPAIRAGSETRFESLPEPEIAGEIHLAKGRDGAPEVPVVVYRPEGRKQRAAILHIHGGGMVLGSALSMRHGPANAAASHDCVVVSVDYRLAPETPFPGPQEDCYTALGWLFANADMLGIDTKRVAIMGESAGGGLAAALALMVRDRGDYALCAQILTYPMLDARTGGPDCLYRNPVTGEFVWTADKNQFGWSCLRGDYGCDDDRLGWFSPALAKDVSGLPPAWIGTGSLDLFFDENLDFARRLCAAGVNVDVNVWPGAFHGFNMFIHTAIAQKAARDFNGAIGRLLGTTTE